MHAASHPAHGGVETAEIIERSRNGHRSDCRCHSDRSGHRGKDSQAGQFQLLRALVEGHFDRSCGSHAGKNRCHLFGIRLLTGRCFDGAWRARNTLQQLLEAIGHSRNCSRRPRRIRVERIGVRVFSGRTTGRSRASYDAEDDSTGIRTSVERRVATAARTPRRGIGGARNQPHRGWPETDGALESP